MGDRSGFWKGVAVGFLGGIAAFAFMRRPGADGETSERDQVERIPVAEGEALAGSTRKIALRRDAAESAGDPRMTSPGSVPGVLSGRAFERPPGAPGGRTPVEKLEVPGRRGQMIDHTTRSTGKT